MSSRTTNQSDVIVVGAGPIGLVAALLIADAGIRTTVVERALAPSDLPRAISLQDESLRTFEQLGIAEALKAESLLDTGSRYFGLDDRLLAEAKPVPSRIGQPAKTQFDQPILEQLLFDRAVEHPGIELLLGTEAVELVHDTEGVVLTVEGPDASGEQVRRELRAGWLLGADGGKSFTRAALGIDLVGTTQPQRWIVIDLLGDETPREKFADFHCDGERPYVLVPGIKGRLRIEFMLFDHEDADEMTRPERIHDLVVPKFRRELDPDDVRRAAVYVAHQRVARHYRRGRAFLIGDAAHLMPPFAGQGLNAGVRDAHNAAWKIIEAVKGGATEALLDSYETERRTHGAKMVEVSRRIGAVVMATNPAATRVRDAAVRVVNLVPKARRFLANMRFITPPDYADGVAVAPAGGTTPLPGVEPGKALSQPTVVDADGVERGLDAHLGAGWSVIGLGADPGQLDPYWTGIDAELVRLLPPASRPRPAVGDGPGSTQVAETQPVLTGSHTGKPVFIAVRPDRYVAAVFAPADEQRVIGELRHFVDDRARAARRTASERA
ncbi:MAG: monooxygenase [Microbacteriaceae bacterium]|nr:monooxygenase [Microbacteriaceae bacterium]